jgi:hypothetical protein
MLNNDSLSLWFVFMTLFNTGIGLNNQEKNSKQEDKQKQIENKLDKILKILEENNEQ